MSHTYMYIHHCICKVLAETELSLQKLIIQMALPTEALKLKVETIYFKKKCSIISGHYQGRVYLRERK